MRSNSEALGKAPAIPDPREHRTVRIGVVEPSSACWEEETANRGSIKETGGVKRCKMNRVGLEQAWLMIHHPENQLMKLRYGEGKTTKSVRGTRQLEQGRHAHKLCLVIDEGHVRRAPRCADIYFRRLL